MAHRLPSGSGDGQIDHDRLQRHCLCEQGLVADNLLRASAARAALFPYPLAQVYATAQGPGFQSGELFLGHFRQHGLRA